MFDYSHLDRMIAYADKQGVYLIASCSKCDAHFHGMSYDSFLVALENMRYYYRYHKDPKTGLKCVAGEKFLVSSKYDRERKRKHAAMERESRTREGRGGLLER